MLIGCLHTVRLLQYCYRSAINHQSPTYMSLKIKHNGGLVCFKFNSNISVEIIIKEPGLNKSDRLIGVDISDQNTQPIRAKVGRFKSSDFFGCRVTDCSANKILFS